MGEEEWPRAEAATKAITRRPDHHQQQQQRQRAEQRQPKQASLLFWPKANGQAQWEVFQQLARDPTEQRVLNCLLINFGHRGVSINPKDCFHFSDTRYLTDINALWKRSTMSYHLTVKYLSQCWSVLFLADVSCRSAANRLQFFKSLVEFQVGNRKKIRRTK